MKIHNEVEKWTTRQERQEAKKLIQSIYSINKVPEFTIRSPPHDLIIKDPNTY